MSRRHRMLRSVTLLASVLAAAPGCSKREGPAPAAADPRSPLSVRVFRVESGGERAGLIVPGRVTAREEVVVRATISGRITSLPLREGQGFSKGTALARFEAPESKASVTASRAAEEAARHRLDLARRQEARLDSLHARRVAALRELELAQDERLAAEAAYEAATAAREGLLSGTEIRAPFGGVVVRRHVDPGATVAAGEPVLEIRSGAAGEVVAAIPEAWLRGLPASRVQIRVAGGRWIDARIARIEGMTDYRSRTREARFVPQSNREPLEPGAYADVRLLGAAASGTPPRADTAAVGVPPGALVHRGALTGVYVVRDGRAWLRWVRAGRSDAERVEILAGLLPGDVIALDPSGLTDGRAVAVAP